MKNENAIGMIPMAVMGGDMYNAGGIVILYIGSKLKAAGVILQHALLHNNFTGQHGQQTLH